MSNFELFRNFEELYISSTDPLWSLYAIQLRQFGRFVVGADVEVVAVGAVAVDVGTFCERLRSDAMVVLMVNLDGALAGFGWGCDDDDGCAVDAVDDDEGFVFVGRGVGWCCDCLWLWWDTDAGCRGDGVGGSDRIGQNNVLRVLCAE